MVSAVEMDPYRNRREGEASFESSFLRYVGSRAARNSQSTRRSRV